MKRIFLVRHAKSEHGSQYSSDYDRPLNKRGRTDAQMMAEQLKSIISDPAFFNISPALRAKETAQFFISAFSPLQSDQINYETQLYLPTVSVLWETIKKTPAQYDSLILFSHNMALEDLVNHYQRGFRMRTCSIVELYHPDESWETAEPSKTKFRNHFYPKMYKQ